MTEQMNTGVDVKRVGVLNLEEETHLMEGNKNCDNGLELETSVWTHGF